MIWVLKIEIGQLMSPKTNLLTQVIGTVEYHNDIEGVIEEDVKKMKAHYPDFEEIPGFFNQYKFTRCRARNHPEKMVVRYVPMDVEAIES